MTIKSLRLSNYRNYDALSIDFSKKTNILHGDNAQGKTNILEAIYLCTTTKSHRGSKDREIISINEEESHIRMMIDRDGLEHRIDMHLKKYKPKGVAIDGLFIKKTVELFGLAHVILFSPEDLGIIKNGPSERRRFMDMELCQLDRIYIYNLSNYNKVLSQRNNLLRQIGHNRELLDTIQIWDYQLFQFGIPLIRTREAFIGELNEILSGIHGRLTADREDLKIEYAKDVEADSFMDKMARGIEKDVKNKMTCAGPHRDELVFTINGLDAKKYGSQGQQRTSALSLKLAEIELVRRRIREEPVLLLDDVLSELDENRRNQLLNNIRNTQTIMTCTGLMDYVGDRADVDRVYHVEGGKVMQMDNWNGG